MVILRSNNFIFNLINYLSENYQYLIQQMITQLSISLIGLLFAALIGLAIGILISEKKSIAGLIIQTINILQTIPSIALLTILLIFFGLGSVPVILCIVVYGILPVVKNTTLGLNSVDFDIIDSAKGIGMTRLQILFKIKLPLSKEYIYSGIRNSIFISVGTSTIGSFVGAGGVGDIILRGISISSGSVIILTGVLLSILTAFILDRLFIFFTKFI